jgi:hypothetical protein
MITEIPNVNGKTIERIEVVGDIDGQYVNMYFTDGTVTALILKKEIKITALEYTPEDDARREYELTTV